MKTLTLAASILVSGALLPQSIAFAHGGTYRGPGDTVPGGAHAPGGIGGVGPGGLTGPSSPGGGNPVTPGGATPGAGLPGAPRGVATGSTDSSGVDLTQWPFWWELNKEPYLDLRTKVRRATVETGSDTWFIGNAPREGSKDRMAPSEEQIRNEIVPALLKALETESDNHVVTGCLVALAKIGDGPTETGASRLEPVIARFLADKNQEISETAAVALGILANPQSIGLLDSLLADDAEGRKRVDRPEVDYRTRAFAAYGLGLIGARASDEADRQRIVSILHRMLETDSTRTRDVKVSCIIALGLVPLETVTAAAADGSARPESSRCAQIDYLLSFLRDERQNDLVRAHCPTALARLIEGLPPAQHAAYREKLAAELLERIEPRKKESEYMVQSAVYALGLLGTNDGVDPLDQRIRAALAAAPKTASDLQARNFALIALAKSGGRFAQAPARPEDGIDEVSKALLGQLADGKAALGSWAALACGVLGHELLETSPDSPKVGALQRAVRESLRDTKNPTMVGALAISSGLLGDVEAAPLLLARLKSEKDDDACGYVAVGLGLMGARDAVAGIQAIVAESKYRPELLKQTAIALGLLGDKSVVPQLLELLQEARGLASQASVASALGFIGDRRSVAPLTAMLANPELTPRARAFAAVALGLVGDKELLPWSTKIGLDLNYRATTQTLTDRTAGTGILDIL